ncbi:MAG: GNAT family N-acetyltransferase [Opitutales bacterium]|nr:GNAT family N-acetyltransferase [Opitutales bacterium]
MALTTEIHRGADATPHLKEVARLRTTVFREWPYLYEGDIAYETQYLRRYATCPDFLLVLARADGEVVGASTGQPMSAESTAFKAPFEAAGESVNPYFYCGESVVLPAFRGNGLGKAFFVARETHARNLPGIRHTCFCAIERPLPDSRRPSGHRELHNFWARLGYTRHPSLAASLEWKEIGTGAELVHTLPFWTKTLSK